MAAKNAQSEVAKIKNKLASAKLQLKQARADQKIKLKTEQIKLAGQVKSGKIKAKLRANIRAQELRKKSLST